jgi:uncharacterized protein (TIGR02145 family)
MKKSTLLFIALLTMSSFGFSQTVIIGTQVWATKNLDVSTFRNGDPIPQAKSDAEWVAAGENYQPAWCYYDNDPKNGTKYGKLYNWFAVRDARGLAPAGWHVPTDEEWTILPYYVEQSYQDELNERKVKEIQALGTNPFAEDIMKIIQQRTRIENEIIQQRTRIENEIIQQRENEIIQQRKRIENDNGAIRANVEPAAATVSDHVTLFNPIASFGFSCLCGGFRRGDGYFHGVDYGVFWWSASEDNGDVVWCHGLSTENSDLYRECRSRTYGFYVRCVKD